MIRNTNTAMGRALAAAMGGVTLTEESAGRSRMAGADRGKSAGAGNASQAKGSVREGGAGVRRGSVLAAKISDPAALAAELGIGEITLKDIVAELEKPSRDPRESMPAPILRSDVLDMKDLKPGMILKGTVRNIVDFGAFVDIGVHQDGLVHISRITQRFIKHPLEAVSVGDIVDVKVLEVDTVKKRIALTMRLDEKE